MAREAALNSKGRGVAVLAAGLVLLTLPACAQAPVPPPKPAPAAATSADEAGGPAFSAWLRALKAEARQRGISEATLARAFRDVAPNPRVLELDRRQPEFTSTFWGYYDRAVSPDRVRDGRAMLARHRALLDDLYRRTGIPPQVIVAFWGVETNYGRNLGGFNVIEALATLAHDARRGAFFREQLLTALAILDQGHIAPETMVGSWAGAMGQMQFMPTTFRDHAVDGDGDGRKDIWTDLKDAFESAAGFLTDLGWRADQTWGRQVRLPPGFDLTQSDLDVRKPLTDWAALGVARADGQALPVVPGMTASLLLPAGHEGPAFLVYDNFRVIMRWNNSSLYALAVGRLADRIAGDGSLVGVFDRAPDPLRYSELRTLQHLLNHLGFEAGPVDGLAGPSTRSAIRRFQATQGLPADGHADPALLRHVQRLAAGQGSDGGL
ncbi:lytic murein transglycosylase [uncultured Rhodospira sp.]|uniref:lytic murein transglycosylase n=1 Tax=uncultured Rhodospira sp. TaxID=1936189 RepID=UPI0026056469|nr:lytic murein transglycosylase [uncultured Rhodospira sp.]